MAETKISHFKMLKKPPYKLPDTKTYLELVMTKGVKEEEKNVWSHIHHQIHKIHPAVRFSKIWRNA